MEYRFIYVFKQSSRSLPEAAVDNEENRNEEGGHLAGVDKGVRPVGGGRHTRERVRERKSKYCPLRETAEEAFLVNCFLKSARSNYGAKHGRGKVRKHQH